MKKSQSKVAFKLLIEMVSLLSIVAMAYTSYPSLPSKIFFWSVLANLSWLWYYDGYKHTGS